MRDKNKIGCFAEFRVVASKFFSWLSQHFASAFIFVECKNYGKEVGNPELDQLSGRFSPSRGKVGILVCRSIEKPIPLEKRCIDTAKDHRGYILTLSDTELVELMEAAKAGVRALLPIACKEVQEACGLMPNKPIKPTPIPLRFIGAAYGRRWATGE